MHKQWLITAVAALVMAYGINAKASDDWTKNWNKDNWNKGWTFEFTPYLWAAGIDGDATVRGQKVNVDMSFHDLFDAVDIAGSFLGIARKNRFVMWTQFDYFGLDSNKLDDAPPNARLRTDTLLFELAAGYQFDGPFKGSKIDTMLGMRYGHFETKLTVLGAKANNNTDLFDPMLVVRPRLPITDWLAFNPTLAVGGGGDSELIYELQPQLEFLLNKYIVARVGYRRLHYKYEGKRDNEFDGSFQGFIVGLGATF